MRKHKVRKVKNTSIISAFTTILPIFIFVVVLVIVMSGLSGASESVESEGLRVAEDAVYRAAVSCYAVEGCYPDSYEYLRDNYGLSVNVERYFVHYQIFAGNIMPDITVISKGGVS
jgi:hypothetical protein